MKLLKRASWLFLAMLQFIAFVVVGAMFASAWFFDGKPTAELVVTHALVIIVTGAIAALLLAAIAYCLGRAIE